MDTRALRQKILDLAIRGKLVPQDLNDEPASVLLERIREHKKQMVQEGKLRVKDIKNDSVIFVGEDALHYEKFADGNVKCIEDEIPFELPDGWEWCRLGNVSEEIFAGGDKPDDVTKEPDMEHPFPIYSNGIENDGLYGYSAKARVYHEALTVSARGTIGFSCIRRTPFTPVIRLITIIFSEFCSIEYCKIVFDGLMVQSEGSSIPQLTVPGIKPKLIPVPPYKEQVLIAEKTTDIMNKINDIEDQKNVFMELLDDTKHKILDLAIRGKLVPQDPNDEPASVLLERIRTEKEELIKQGKIKRNKKESVIFKGEDNSYYEKINQEVRCIDKEIPFELPDSWTFARLKHIGKIVGGGTPKTNINEYWNGDIPWLTPTDFSDYEDIYVSAGARTITEAGLQFSSATMLPKNTVLFSSRAPIGYIAIAANPVSTNQGFKSVVPFDSAMSTYLYYCLKARTSDIIQRATGTTFKEISGSEMAETMIPVPPVNEQKRIFDKIKKLFCVLANIEKSLT